MDATKKEEQRRLLAELVKRAKDGGIKIRWCDTEIVVLGLQSDGEEKGQGSDPRVSGEPGPEGREDEGTEQSSGSGEDARGGKEEVGQKSK